MNGTASRRNLPRWLALSGAGLISVFLIFVFYKAFGTNPREVPFKLAGKPAPNFSLVRLDTGEKVELSSLEGKPVVLNFWSTWCGPCRQEHPVLDWGSAQFSDVQFLGVVFEDTEANARSFLQEMGARFPQLLDPSGGMAVDYGVAGVPETYFINSAGIIVEKYAAPIDPQTLTMKVRALLSGAN